MATITWSVIELNVIPSDGSLQNVISSAYIKARVEEGNNSAEICPTCTLPPPDINTFIPYENLTEQQVLDWCWANGVDKQETESILLSQNFVVNTVVNNFISLPLPWNENNT